MNFSIDRASAGARPPAAYQADLGAAAARGACALVTTAILGAAVGCSTAQGDRDVYALEQKPLQRTALLTGEVRTARADELIAPAVGMWPIPIVSILEDGTEVQEGQAIAEFDNSNLVGGLDRTREQAAQAETTLLATQARMQSEEADARFEVEEKRLALDKAKLEADLPRELSSERDYQLKQLALRRAELEHATAQTKLENQLRKANAEIGISQVALDKARTEVRRTEQSLEVVVLRAPKNGTLEIAYSFDLGRPYRSGDNAQPGRPVALFPDYSTLRVEAFLFDVDEGSIAAGAPSTVVLDAYPQRSFAGHVESIQEVAQQPTPISSRRAFRVVVGLETPDPTVMKVGMSVKVEVESEIARWRGEPTQVVQRTALHFAEDAQVDGPRSARIRTSDGWTSITVGLCSASECIVMPRTAGEDRAPGTVAASTSAAGAS